MTHVFAAALRWLESSGLAGVIRDSTLLTGALSAVHLLGVTLVGGGALLSGLQCAGVLFADQPTAHVVRPANRAILLGFAISIVTGVLLFSARASVAVQNGFFQLKMALLLAAIVCQALVFRRAGRGGAGAERVIGAVGSALCFGVIFAGCAFILLE